VKIISYNVGRLFDLSLNKDISVWKWVSVVLTFICIEGRDMGRMLLLFWITLFRNTLYRILGCGKQIQTQVIMLEVYHLLSHLVPRDLSTDRELVWNKFVC
jgi:hypothetical protein